MRTDTAPPVRLSDYRAPAYRVAAMDLTFDLSPEATRVTARSTVQRMADAPEPLRLDGERLTLESIAIDGAALAPEAYALDGEGLTIHAPPAAFTLEIVTLIHPIANTALEGLYVSSGRFCTQCEAEGFRKITYSLDRPNNLAVFDVRIEADKSRYPTLLSNGDLILSGDLGGGRHFAHWRDPHPKPTYLFALVAGAFDALCDTFRTRSGRDVQLGVYVDENDSPRARYAMDALKRAMAWDEAVFGREYDLAIFNIVAVRDFNFGAMENKGLNVFNSAYVLADPQTATDADFEAIEGVVAHEYFHNWTGNRITLRDWFQLCLKEGLTVFRDQEFSADQRSRPVQRIKDVKRLRARQFPEDAGPLAHPVRPAEYKKIDNFYTATVYEKGAEVIRLLKAMIGDAAFAKGMALYFDRCDGTAATVEDFIACFAEASGSDLADFARWYAQAGTPTLRVRSVYDGLANKTVLTLQQETPPTPGQPEKQPLPIPLKIGFLSPTGAILAAKRAGEESAHEEHRLVMRAARLELAFEGVMDRPIPAVLRGFSAPVILDDGLSLADRFVQMAHEPDAFTRWEAGQEAARAVILGLAAHGAANTDALVAALSKVIAGAAKDPAFAALALRLPDLPDLLQATDHPDPDKLYAARETLRSQAARALKPQLVDIAARSAAPPDQVDAAASGARALKSAALDLLAALGSDTTHVLVSAFADARTMTEQAASLEALGANGAAQFDDALGLFRDRWKDNPLVMDKWFALQSAAPRHDALARVAALLQHPDYDAKNPNRVRSVAMAFAQRNPRAFHAASGEGYRFLAKIADSADRTNPALAARLLGAFESWRRFDAGRQAQARHALESLLERGDLSKNAREIVERTLA